MINTDSVRLTQAEVRKELRALGISFRSLPETGEFKVDSSYFTDDLEDALLTGRAIANARQSAILS